MINFIVKYIPLILTFGAFLILFFLISYFIDLYRKRKVNDLLTTFCLQNGYRLSVANKKIYDFLLEVEDKKLFVKVLYVPLQAAITINSKDTWNLTYGGVKGRPGRGYRHQRYLTELRPFLIREFAGTKVVLIYPTIDKVQRYLNESEIAILNYKEDAYGIRFITYADWNRAFQDLI